MTLAARLRTTVAVIAAWNPLHLANVFLTLTLLGVVACGGQSCEEKEAVGYPEMEAMAKATLDDVEYSLERYGGCEDMGRPLTGLWATVNGWAGRRVADGYFEQRGWTRGVGDKMTSPDGVYRANIMTSRLGTDQASFVSLQFSESADFESAN